jgi:Cdc6-like AAA superfamily ATPase
MQTEELDDLVQHLAVAKYALEAGDSDRASSALDSAMEIARRVLTRNHQAKAGPAADAPMVRSYPSS